MEIKDLVDSHFVPCGKDVLLGNQYLTQIIGIDCVVNTYARLNNGKVIGIHMETFVADEAFLMLKTLYIPHMNFKSWTHELSNENEENVQKQYDEMIGAMKRCILLGYERIEKNIERETEEIDIIMRERKEKLTRVKNLLEKLRSQDLV
jgi:hypothetical protein